MSLFKPASYNVLCCHTYIAYFIQHSGPSPGNKTNTVFASPERDGFGRLLVTWAMMESLTCIATLSGAGIHTYILATLVLRAKRTLDYGPFFSEAGIRYSKVGLSMGSWWGYDLPVANR